MWYCFALCGPLVPQCVSHMHVTEPPVSERPTCRTSYAFLAMRFSLCVVVCLHQLIEWDSVHVCEHGPPGLVLSFNQFYFCSFSLQLVSIRSICEFERYVAPTRSRHGRLSLKLSKWRYAGHDQFGPTARRSWYSGTWTRDSLPASLGGGVLGGRIVYELLCDHCSAK